MENNEKVVSIVGVTLLTLVGILALFSVATKIQASLSNDSFGTNLTMNSSSGSYTDGQDKIQNLQAIAERFTGLSQNQLLQADSTGRMQVVSSISALTQGGGATVTSTSGSVVPLTLTDFDTENLVSITLNLVDATVSFPASSTLTTVVPNTGDTRTIYFRNATTTAAMDLTFSGGTGVLMKVASSTEGSPLILPGDTDGANTARVTLQRKSNTDIVALLEKFVD